jgi:small-conductance mechanosensitive channel
MPDADFYTAESYLARNEDWIVAVVIVIVAFVVAEVVDRMLARQGKGLSQRVAGGELSPVANTRLRLVRRLIFALIIVIGLAFAVWQFGPVRQVATGILASSAVLGLVVGFAARATLANAIAGILLAITQPIRIGDLVTFEDKTGEVEDVRLSYTYIRLDNGHRLIVPNERLAQSSVENFTIHDPRVQVEVSVWLAPDADLDQAIELIESEDDGVTAVVAEVDKEGVRLSATTWAANAAARGPVAAELRRRWLRELREHGLSSVEAS